MGRTQQTAWNYARLLHGMMPGFLFSYLLLCSCIRSPPMPSFWDSHPSLTLVGTGNRLLDSGWRPSVMLVCVPYTCSTLFYLCRYWCLPTQMPGVVTKLTESPGSGECLSKLGCAGPASRDSFRLWLIQAELRMTIRIQAPCFTVQLLVKSSSYKLWHWRYTCRKTLCRPNKIHPKRAYL